MPASTQTPTAGTITSASVGRNSTMSPASSAAAHASRGRSSSTERMASSKLAKVRVAAGVLVQGTSQL